VSGPATAHSPVTCDPVTRPDWYTWIPGIECMDVARHFPYCLGAAIKYIWRAGRKDPAKRGEDLRKAIEYLRRELAYAEGANLEPREKDMP
jgi:hypothetical protein